MTPYGPSHSRSPDGFDKWFHAIDVACILNVAAMTERAKLGFTFVLRHELRSARPFRRSCWTPQRQRRRTLDEAPTDAFGHVVPIGGSIAIEHDGWAVKGSFRADTLCTWWSSH
jgi:hypothetical protein